MIKIKNFLKYFSFPIVCFAGLISFASYMAWSEFHINQVLVNESLKGNRHAIKILSKYEKPWKLDSKIITAAIEGNKYALEVLKIDENANLD